MNVSKNDGEMLRKEEQKHFFVISKDCTYVCRSGLPDFSWYKIPKWGKIYQIATNYTKCP
jgi:hypothetical protein